MLIMRAVYESRRGEHWVNGSQSLSGPAHQRGQPRSQSADRWGLRLEQEPEVRAAISAVAAMPSIWRVSRQRVPGRYGPSVSISTAFTPDRVRAAFGISVMMDQTASTGAATRWWRHTEFPIVTRP